MLAALCLKCLLNFMIVCDVNIKMNVRTKRTSKGFIHMQLQRICIVFLLGRDYIFYRQVRQVLPKHYTARRELVLAEPIKHNTRASTHLV